MSTPDQEAIVLATAKAIHGVENTGTWESQPVEDREFYLDFGRTVTRATLTALMPLADGWEDVAEKNDRLGMSRIERAEAAAADGDGDAEDDQLKYARVAFASRDAHKACARELRGVMGS